MARYLGRFLVFTTFAGVAEVDDFEILNLETNPDGTLHLTPLHPARFTSQTETSRDFQAWQIVTNSFSIANPGDSQHFFRLKLK